MHSGINMKYILFLLMLAFTSCISKLNTEPEFNLDLDSYAEGTDILKESSKLIMNGVYKVISGNDILGDEVAGKWIGNRWCLYSSHDVVFSENAGGYSKNSTGNLSHQIIFTGYIRIVRSGKGVILNMSIQAEDGADSLYNVITPKSIIIKGSTSDKQNIILVRVRDLYKSNKNFQILAHRGGSRNSERLGRSENSLEMMKYAQILGATGIEIDVRPTRDKKLIIFHDDTFSPRTVQGSYLLGNVEDFDLAQIKLFGTLINGESIPTLDEALETVIDSTLLTTVWLDIKNPSIVEDVINSQKKAIDRAVSIGRTDLKIYLGIPDQNVLDSYSTCANKNTTPVLIEFSSELASEYPTCEVWAPKWTIGIPTPCGKKIFVWTLDVHDFISDFLNSNNINGILTNYPSLVAGMDYLRTQ
jgi:glycerophosphoryl diester phosphodiesterase